MKGRHGLKFGGQWLHYDQRRFYAGNNGLLGFINYNGAFTGYAFSDFLLDLSSSKGRGGGDPTKPWTHLQDRIGLFAQDDVKVTDSLTLNLGLRWAYTSPLVEKDNKQSNFDLATGQQIFAKDGSIQDRALYKPYLQRLGAAAGRRVEVRGPVGRPRRVRDLAVHGGDGRQPAPADEPALHVRVGRELRHHDRRRQRGERVRRPRAGHEAVGQRARVRPEPAAAVHAAVERVRRAAADGVDVRADRLRRPQGGPPGRARWKATRRSPGVGDPATWAPKATRRPLYAAQPLVTTIATTAARGGSRYNSMQASVRQRMLHGLEFLVSYTLAKGRTNNRGFYGVFGGTGPQGVTGATEGAYWQNTYDPEADWGPAFHDVRHNVIVSGGLGAAVRQGPCDRRELERRRRRHPRGLAPRRDLPGAIRPAGHGDRRRARDRSRASAAASGRTAWATGSQAISR